MIGTEWFLAVLYLLGGMNDLFMDLVFYVKPLRRWISQGRKNPVATPDELEGIPEQPIAILIPAWDESAVIGAMLESTCSRVDYTNYDIFVGTYPNDEETQMEVARAAFDHPRIHRVVCPNPGPTSKADCLNWVVEAIKLREQETGRRYAIFTLQDAEDVVHPLTLKVFNRFIPEYDMIQVPVVPYERYLHKLTGGTYLDEFAEVHLKNLDARQAVGGMVPSAGVGTGFGRDACDELAAQTNHILFPPVSLTEDYDFSFRLFRNGRKSGLAKVWTWNEDNPKNRYRELVAIREFFPAKFGDAVRQKQRWMLGITFQGWEKLGWGTSWRERYMLLRDRIGVLTSLLNAVTALVVLRVIEAILWALAHHLAWNADMAQFQLPPALLTLIDINVALLGFRIMQRAYCVQQVARRRQVVMVPLRLVWANVIDFYCTVHAIRRYVHSRVTGTPLKWLKTAHEFPNVEQLLRTHRRLGDLLLEQRLILPAQLTEALAEQKYDGIESRLLGEILLERQAISAAQLAETLSLQARSKVRVQEAAQAELAEQPVAARREESRLEIQAAQDYIDSQPQLVPAAALPRAVLVRPLTLAELTSKNPPAWVAAGLSGTHFAAEPEPYDPLKVEAAAAAPGLAATELQEPIRQPPPMVDIPARPGPELVPPLFLQERATKERDREERDRGERVAPPAGRVPAAPFGPAPVIPFESAQRRQGRLLQRFITPEAARSKTKPAAPTAPASRRFSMLHSVASRWKTPFPSKRILIAIGTRPEAIKLAPLVCELKQRIGMQGGPERVFVCATGQHQEMVEAALAGFGVHVDLNLHAMTPGQTLAEVSARVLARFADVIAEFQPDWVVVQGDTATTSMAALAAFYAGVRVAHVEAGLRTRDLMQPFPEEFNRRMVGMFADMHFAATDWARQNLLREGVDERDIIVTGNTGIDALRGNCERLGLHLERKRPLHSGQVRVLITAHRRENLEDGIANICEAIANLVTSEPGRYLFLWPLHPNPRVGDIARAYLDRYDDVLLTGPAHYDELLGYLDRSDIVVTDSGGLQEEAPSFGRPVLILRDKTERPEGVKAGMAWLVGTDPVRIETAIRQLAEQIAEQRSLRNHFNPYGDGFASLRIADFFSGRPVREFGEVEQDELGGGYPPEREWLQTVG